MAHPDSTSERAPVVVAVSAPGTDTAALERLLADPLLPRQAAIVLVFQQREVLDVERLRGALAGTGRAITPIADGTAAEVGGLYLPEPDVILDVEDGRFRTRPAEGAVGHRATIDSLLVSLARDREGRVVAVALAGTDGSGTLGFKAVKEADGLTLAQDTVESRAGELAASDGPAALADAVLPVDALAARLAAFVAHLLAHDGARAIEDGRDALPSDREADALRAVALMLRNGTGHDFHGYKPGTFLRRVRRRMQVVDVPDLPAYVEALRARPGEVQALFNDLLIGVTRFFRDPKEYERLARDVIPGLFEGKGRGDQLRVWVIGCSTGEEAYSLGILLSEHMAGLDEVPHVQIFATDLDGRALAAARAARYADGIRRDVDPARLARWFVREGNTYRVVRELRELCVFSQHSIVKDAPFSRLDIVSCRNLLIYLATELQGRIIPLFHFALREGGVLFLGSSENASRHARLFAPIEAQSRIFRRVETGARVLPEFPFSTASVPSGEGLAPARDARPAEVGLTRRAERLAERYAPAYVIVDDNHDVLHFSGRTGRYIDPAGGAASLNLLQLVHRDLRPDLRGALARAAAGDETVRVEGVRVGQNGDSLFVDVVVEAVREENARSRNFLVLFRDGGSAREVEATGAAVASRQAGHAQRLEAELRATQDRLQTTNEELESTNEELKASNEEYQALNEELQSMNEELQTSKEELQSVNEELTTLNGELAYRVRDLSRANSDLRNLMESTQIATLFLDDDLRVANFTPAATELFHLVESDVGRPIAHIKSRVAYDGMQDDVRSVLRTLVPVQRDVGGEETAGQYIARVLPYRSTDNFIAGVVVTFVDVTPLKRAEQSARVQEERFRALVSATSNSMYLMSADWSEMRELAGRGFLADTVRPSAAWLSEYIYPEDQAGVLAAIQKAIRTRSNFELEHRVRRADGRVGWTLSRAVPLLDEDGSIREWFGAASDVTARRLGPDGAAAMDEAD